MFLKSLIEVETLAFVSIAGFVLTLARKNGGFVCYHAVLLCCLYGTIWFFRSCGQILKWGHTALADFFSIWYFLIVAIVVHAVLIYLLKHK